MTDDTQEARLARLEVQVGEVHAMLSRLVRLYEPLLREVSRRMQGPMRLTPKGKR